MNKLDGKKILLIAPKYFDYENKIKRKLEECGASVWFIQENVDVTYLKFKTLNKFPEHIRVNIINKYYKQEFDKKRDIKFDIIFCIRVNLFNDYIMNTLKTYFPCAKYVLYFWDSCRNMRNAYKVSKYFDKVFTFDKSDAQKYDKWNFRPLFYLPEYKNHEDELVNKQSIDILYIASLSKERADYYIKLNEYCKQNRLILDTYFVCSPVIFYWNYWKVDSFRKVPTKLIHQRGLSLTELLERMKKTKVVFDCSHSSQTGLTMRTIECLGAEKKMITTNSNIRDYDFFIDSNILLINDYDFENIKDFVENRIYSKVNDKLMYKYSLEGWLDEILD